MPRVPIKDIKQYEKALEVLSRVGGTFQGVGREAWALLVSDAQYQALLDAKVVAGDHGTPEQKRGQTSKGKTRL